MTEAKRILGIDPGTRNVGFGIIEAKGTSFRFVASGCITSKKDTIAERLVDIHKGLQKAIKENSPTVAAVETVFAGENIKTAIAIGEGRGVAILSAAELGLEIVGFEPTVVKRAVTGSGRAGKEQVQEMIRVLLGLKEIPATDHEADALALAITYVHRGNRPSPSPRSRRGTARGAKFSSKAVQMLMNNRSQKEAK